MAAASNARGPSNGHGPTPHAVDLNPMEFIEQNHGAGGGNPNAASGPPGNNGSAHGMPPTAPFELDFDKFDMLTEFPELDHYHSQNAAAAGAAQSANSAMIHHGASGPLLSSTMPATTPPGGAAGKRHHITEYSPDWAWSDVSTLHGSEQYIK